MRNRGEIDLNDVHEVRPPRCEDEPIQHPVAQEEAGADPGAEGRDGGMTHPIPCKRVASVV